MEIDAKRLGRIQALVEPLAKGTTITYGSEDISSEEGFIWEIEMSERCALRGRPLWRFNLTDQTLAKVSGKTNYRLMRYEVPEGMTLGVFKTLKGKHVVLGIKV